MLIKYCVYDTLTENVVFHESEDEAVEDYKTVMMLMELLQAKEQDVYLFEVKNKMRYI